MKKIGLIVVGVAVVATVIYFAMANKKEESSSDSSTTGQENSQSNDQPSPAAQKTSLKDLVAGVSQQCTYNDGHTEGTVYTSGGKARMEITSVTNGITASFHAIMDGTTYYQWADGQPNGFKFEVNKSSTGSAGPSQNVDVNQQVDYNCQNWPVDASKFVLPANMEFMDISSFTPPTGN